VKLVNDFEHPAHSLRAKFMIVSKEFADVIMRTYRDLFTCLVNLITSGPFLHGFGSEEAVKAVARLSRYKAV
jgi:hypothetical protein